MLPVHLRRSFYSVGLLIAMSVTASMTIAAQSPPASPKPGEGGPADVASDADVQAAQRLFTAWLEGQMLSRHLPGVAIGVVADQELIWSKGFGFADTANKIAMTPQTKFRMASHSKLFTATAVMQLRERGLLRLDDPVSKHLRGSRSRWPNPTIRRLRSKSCSRIARVCRAKRARTGPPSSSQPRSSCAS